MKLKNLIQTERKITAEIVELIREIDSKRTYLNLGHTSMFSFLTKEMGYTPAAAMRRIDAARLLKEVPELQKDLKSGEINLSQVSMLAQAVRQKEKENNSKNSKIQKINSNEKRVLLEKVRSKDLVQTQKALAQDLDLQVKDYEKKIVQKDESFRVEVTLTKEQMQQLERVKELISHQNPNPNWAELVSLLAENFLKQKDPLQRKTTSAAVPASRHKTEEKQIKNTQNKRYIPQKIRTEIFQRDQSCQWVSLKLVEGRELKHICGSKFQLQVDHIEPIWQDGKSEKENLQLLCSTHNKLKYRQEKGG